ncbi:S41 family peptidase [uncultured Treponema sp.]|uniref:S41 family peptidase n=1 Tax=uncultured Treponema sp. TaxID=162155 RepID=UPI0025F30779|nr:S41 family peptidase [uncultured Treponema sp.]
MKKQIVSLVTAGFAAVSLTFTLASCANEGDVTNITNVVYNDAQEESTNFVSESLPFYKLSNTPSDTLYARFYNGEHYVPYVSLKYFLETHDVFQPVKTSYSDGKYSYEYKADGKTFPICVDVKNDTIHCAEWAGFIDETNGEEEDAITKKLLRIIKSYSGQKAQTFDLKKYGMEIYGGVDDAYIPLCVLNCLFTTRNYKEIFYNGEAVYFFDYNNSDFVYENYCKSPWYSASDGSVCERPQKLIDLTYNMLCFTHDYCYGHPGYYGFADDGNGYPNADIVSAADAMSFDEMLTNYAPDVQPMLKSSSYVEYLKGLCKLMWYTYGDCHTGTQFSDYLPPLNRTQLLDWYNFYAGPECQSKKYIENDNRHTMLKEARNAAGRDADTEGNPKPFYVLSGGKTAVFTFDSFFVDIENWKAYYNSTHVAEEPNPDDFEGWSLTFPNDPTADFYKAIYELTKEGTAYPNVETILIDVSCNGGGDDRCLTKILAYMIDLPNFRQSDVHTDTHYSRYVAADLNLDGKIDSKDDEYRNELKSKIKFAVLTSRSSFSCGNAFPAICADEGLPIIGERSGGGACAVVLGCTADGFPYQFSNKLRISHKSDWSSVETGAPITQGGEITPGADFYDDTKLQQIIDTVVK